MPDSFKLLYLSKIILVKRIGLPVKSNPISSFIKKIKNYPIVGVFNSASEASIC